MRRSALLIAFALNVAALTGQDTTRQVWDSAFRDKRPPAPAAAPQRDDHPADYRAGSARPAPLTPATRIIGLTLWRLRPAARDTGARLLVQENTTAAIQEFASQRLPADEPLMVGDRIRIGIEVPLRGYLYVIDRERRADGTTGPPHLIFPARTLRMGDNRVEPGRLIEIPAQTDRVPALIVSRRDQGHIGEELLLVVAPRELPELEPGERERPLEESVVSRLEQAWGVEAQRLDLSGKPAERWWTSAEKDAGVKARLLTQADPMPESLYRAEQKGEALLVRVRLLVR